VLPPGAASAGFKLLWSQRLGERFERRCRGKPRSRSAQSPAARARKRRTPVRRSAFDRLSCVGKAGITSDGHRRRHHHRRSRHRRHRRRSHPCHHHRHGDHRRRRSHHRRLRGDHHRRRRRTDDLRGGGLR